MHNTLGNPLSNITEAMSNSHNTAGSLPGFGSTGPSDSRAAEPGFNPKVEITVRSSSAREERIVAKHLLVTSRSYAASVPDRCSMTEGRASAHRDPVLSLPPETELGTVQSGTFPATSDDQLCGSPPIWSVDDKKQLTATSRHRDGMGLNLLLPDGGVRASTGHSELEEDGLNDALLRHIQEGSVGRVLSHLRQACSGAVQGLLTCPAQNPVIFMEVRAAMRPQLALPEDAVLPAARHDANSLASVPPVPLLPIAAQYLQLASLPGPCARARSGFRGGVSSYALMTQLQAALHHCYLYYSAVLGRLEQLERDMTSALCRAQHNPTPGGDRELLALEQQLLELMSDSLLYAKDSTRLMKPSHSSISGMAPSPTLSPSPLPTGHGCAQFCPTETACRHSGRPYAPCPIMQLYEIVYYYLLNYLFGGLELTAADVEGRSLLGVLAMMHQELTYMSCYERSGGRSGSTGGPRPALGALGTIPAMALCLQVYWGQCHYHRWICLNRNHQLGSAMRLAMGRLLASRAHDSCSAQTTQEVDDEACQGMDSRGSDSVAFSPEEVDAAIPDNVRHHLTHSNGLMPLLRGCNSTTYEVLQSALCFNVVTYLKSVLARLTSRLLPLFYYILDDILFDVAKPQMPACQEDPLWRATQHACGLSVEEAHASLLLLPGPSGTPIFLSTSSLSTCFPVPERGNVPFPKDIAGSSSYFSSKTGTTEDYGLSVGNFYNAALVLHGSLENLLPLRSVSELLEYILSSPGRSSRKRDGANEVHYRDYARALCSLPRPPGVQHYQPQQPLWLSSVYNINYFRSMLRIYAPAVLVGSAGQRGIMLEAALHAEADILLSMNVLRDPSQPGTGADALPPLGPRAHMCLRAAQLCFQPKTQETSCSEGPNPFSGNNSRHGNSHYYNFSMECRAGQADCNVSSPLLNGATYTSFIEYYSSLELCQSGLVVCGNYLCPSLPGVEAKSFQRDLQPRMRMLVVDWLFDVASNLRYKTETVLGGIALMDRYLAVGPGFPRNKLQLLGVVALMIVAKVEEVEPVKASDYSSLTDESFSPNDIIEAERHVLEALGYKRLVPPTAYTFAMMLLAETAPSSMRSIGCDQFYTTAADCLMAHRDEYVQALILYKNRLLVYKHRLQQRRQAQAAERVVEQQQEVRRDLERQNTISQPQVQQLTKLSQRMPLAEIHANSGLYTHQYRLVTHINTGSSIGEEDNHAGRADCGLACPPRPPSPAYGVSAALAHHIHQAGGPADRAPMGISSAAGSHLEYSLTVYLCHLTAYYSCYGEIHAPSVLAVAIVLLARLWADEVLLGHVADDGSFHGAGDRQQTRSGNIPFSMAEAIRRTFAEQPPAVVRSAVKIMELLTKERRYTAGAVAAAHEVFERYYLRELEANQLVEREMLSRLERAVLLEDYDEYCRDRARDGGSVWEDGGNETDLDGGDNDPEASPQPNALCEKIEQSAQIQDIIHMNNNLSAAMTMPNMMDLVIRAVTAAARENNYMRVGLLLMFITRRYDNVSILPVPNDLGNIPAILA